MVIKTSSAHSEPGKTGLMATIGTLPGFRRLKGLPKKVILSLVIAVVVAAAGGVGYYRLDYLPAKAAAAAPAMQTAIVRQGNLVIYASGTGTLVSPDQVDLAFKTSGQVTKVNVAVGDTVKAGDLLAQVDDSSAQVAYAKAKRALMELTSPSAIAAAQTSMAEAETKISSAQSQLEYVLGPNILYWEAQLAKAQAALAGAQAAADKSPSDKDAQAALQKAKDTLAYEQSALDGAWISYKTTYVPNHFTVTDRATGKKYVAAPTDAEILSARAGLASAKAALQEAKDLYAALTGGEVSPDATGSGLTALEQAKLDLQSAQQTLDGTKLYAPIDGTVMSIGTSVGDTASSGSAVITVADLSQPYLEVYLDASDWGNIKTGYPTNVTFDILPDKTFRGDVTEVDPGLYTDNGSSVVRAHVKLNNVDGTSFNLPLGTSASVDVIGGEANNALLVPVEALHQAGDQWAVFVVKNGVPRLQIVQVGIQDSVYAEIKSGLSQGDVVSTGITETK